MAESKWTRHEVQFRGVPNDNRVCLPPDVRLDVTMSPLYVHIFVLLM